MVDLIQVEGPKVVSWSNDGGSNYTALGICTAEGRPQFTREWLTQEVFSDENGDEPVEIVHTGQIITLQFTLVQMDLAQLLLLLAVAQPGVTSTDEEDAGVIGGLWIDHSGSGVPQYDHTFGIRFASVISGRAMESFDRCLFLGEGIREFNKGNDGSQWAFSVRVLRDQTGASPSSADTFYARSTST